MIRSLRQFAFAASFLAGLCLPVVARAQATPIRVSTEYLVLGPGVLDTAAISTAFHAGLTAGSLVRIVPPIDPAAAKAKRVEAARGVVSLSVVGSVRGAHLRVRWMGVDDGKLVVLDSAKSSGSIAFAMVARRMGETSARRVHDLATAKPAHDRSRPR